MFRKILILSLAIIALTSIKANAQYLCGATGYIYRNQGFCNANCSLNGSSSSCDTLTPSTTSAPACPSGYEGFVFNPNTNTTYAVSTNSQFWTYFNNPTSSGSMAVIPDSDTNSLLNSILTYYTIPDAWIGLYNPQMSTDYNTVNPDRPYSWVNGSTPSYYNWASGQPNNNLPSQDLSLLPESEYGQHWIEMESNGTWNDIGYNYTYPSSQNYAPYLPALVQFNNQLSCVSGTQAATSLTSGQQTNLANQYCGGNTVNCYLCSNGSSMAECQSGNTFPSGSAELCPYSQTQCNENTSTPQCPSGSTYNNSSVSECAAPPVCPSGYTLSNGTCGKQVTSTITTTTNPYMQPGGTTNNNGIDTFTINGSQIGAGSTQYDGCGGSQSLAWNGWSGISGFSGSGTAGYFCDGNLYLVGNGNQINAYQLQKQCVFSEVCVKTECTKWGGYRDDTCEASKCIKYKSECTSTKNVYNPVGTIYLSGATASGSTQANANLDWSGNSIWGDGGGTITLSGTSATSTTTTTQTTTATCPSGSTLSNGECASSATCPSGTTLQGNECVSYSCPLGNNDACVNTGSGYYCSPYSCPSYNNSSSYTLNNPNINANNPTNNGQTNSAGQCLGQVYIFSGQAMQCRDPGVQTGWGGGCCTADKRWFGLSSCNSQEKLLAQQRAADDCTMVGTYCAQSFLGFCLQTDQTWCCFPSLLANIIQQQTRAAQSLPISGWGSAQSPNCIGYTPQQFQAINFSQINLSAFYNSIIQQTSSVISNAATNAVNKFKQSLSGQ